MQAPENRLEPSVDAAARWHWISAFAHFSMASLAGVSFINYLYAGGALLPRRGGLQYHWTYVVANVAFIAILPYLVSWLAVKRNSAYAVRAAPLHVATVVLSSLALSAALFRISDLTISLPTTLMLVVCQTYAYRHLAMRRSPGAIDG